MEEIRKTKDIRDIGENASSNFFYVGNYFKCKWIELPDRKS